MSEATVGSPITVTRQQGSGNADKFSITVPTHNYDCATPEQLAAVKLAEDDQFPIELLANVAKSIPQVVPNGSDKGGWGYGACRRTIMIGGHSWSEFENGTVPKDVDLTDIRHVPFYRQAVKNKYTGEVKGFFVTVPYTHGGEVEPGQSVSVERAGFPIGTSHEDITRMATESFLKLQEMCEEFYNRKDER
jgi:hypothetical protein